MKKRILALLTVLCILFAAAPAFAEEISAEPRVYDYAHILSDGEEVDLQQMAEEMQQVWDMDLAFLTLHGTDDLSVQEYGAEFYTEHGFGAGEDADGVIFVLDMKSREGQIVTCGKAIDIYTDYYIEEMWQKMVSHLSDGEYYAAMVTLFEEMDRYNGAYEEYQADPDTFLSAYESEQQRREILPYLGIAAVFSLVIAGVVVASMRKSCRNVRPYTDGRAYLKENGFYLTTNRDSFANTHTSLMPIPRNDDNNHHSGGSWGGGSSTFSSGGRSFGGGGGKF